MIDMITGIDPRLKPTNGIDAGLSAVGKLYKTEKFKI
jgi:hypothetical protein